MSTIWDNGDGGIEEEGMTVQIRAALGEKRSGTNTPVEAYGPSNPPLNAEKRKVHQIFDKLRGKSHNLIEKRKIAEKVLRGEYGIKHELHAKLLLGPRELQEVIGHPADIVLPLLELMNDRTQYVREKIAAVLEKRGDERAIDAMCTKLDADDYSERHIYGVALGKMAKNLSDIESLQKLMAEIDMRREKTEEFTTAWRYVRGRLRELGAVISKPDMKRMVAPKRRSENVTAPLDIKREMIKPEGGSGAPGRKEDMTIPFMFKK